jgi:hypothetical protein
VQNIPFFFDVCCLKIFEIKRKNQKFFLFIFSKLKGRWKMNREVAEIIATEALFEKALQSSNDQNLDRAYLYVHAAATLGHNQSMYLMGKLCLTGTMTPFVDDPDWLQKNNALLAQAKHTSTASK